MEAFIDYLEKERQKSVLVMRSLVDQWQQDSLGMDSFLDELIHHLRIYLVKGGKFHRPLLTRLAYGLYQTENETIMLASQAMELFHRFLLLHDDILDQDLQRHGQPTIQQKYKALLAQRFPNGRDDTFSMGMQLVAGDLVYGMVFDFLASLPLDESVRLTLIRGLYQDIRETSAGWILETHLKQQSLDGVDRASITRAMTLVSAQYSVVWPLRMGQLLAGKKLGDWNLHLERYGLKVGLAFQLMDDILGIFGEQDRTGKPVGNDVREGKKSMLLIEAYTRTNNEGRDLLGEAMGTELSALQLKQVKKVIVDSGALEWAKNTAQAYVHEAVEAIEQVKVNKDGEQARKRLMELAHYLADRDV